MHEPVFELYALHQYVLDGERARRAAAQLGVLFS
jgi:hypothetical protein